MHQQVVQHQAALDLQPDLRWLQLTGALEYPEVLHQQAKGVLHHPSGPGQPVVEDELPDFHGLPGVGLYAVVPDNEVGYQGGVVRMISQRAWRWSFDVAVLQISPQSRR